MKTLCCVVSPVTNRPEYAITDRVAHGGSDNEGGRLVASETGRLRRNARPNILTIAASNIQQATGDQESTTTAAGSSSQPSIVQRRRGRPPKNSSQMVPSAPKRRRELSIQSSTTSTSTTTNRTASRSSTRVAQLRNITVETPSSTIPITSSSTNVLSNDESDGNESDSTVAIRVHEEQQEKAKESFKINTFNVVMDCLLAQISSRFEASKSIAKKFSFLCDFGMEFDLAVMAAQDLASFYYKDLSEDFEQQFRLLRRSKPILFQSEVHSFIPALDLLNAIYRCELSSFMPEICIALRIFLCFFVSVAEGERTFNVLSEIKDDHRTTMSQERLNDLAILSIENEIARTIDYSDIIDEFAKMSARKVNLI